MNADWKTFLIEKGAIFNADTNCVDSFNNTVSASKFPKQNLLADLSGMGIIINLQMIFVMSPLAHINSVHGVLPKVESSQHLLFSKKPMITTFLYLLIYLHWSSKNYKCMS